MIELLSLILLIASASAGFYIANTLAKRRHCDSIIARRLAATRH